MRPIEPSGQRTRLDRSDERKVRSATSFSRCGHIMAPDVIVGDRRSTLIPLIKTAPLRLHSPAIKSASASNRSGTYSLNHSNKKIIKKKRRKTDGYAVVQRSIIKKNSRFFLKLFCIDDSFLLLTSVESKLAQRQNESPRRSLLFALKQRRAPLCLVA